jgi:formyltetrahydrofolate synthetase
MNPYKYKEMQSWLTRPTSPEKTKALEEKHKKDLEERRIKNRKQYGLDTVVYDNSNVVVANNELTTKNQLKEKIKAEENKKSTSSYYQTRVYL